MEADRTGPSLAGAQTDAASREVGPPRPASEDRSRPRSSRALTVLCALGVLGGLKIAAAAVLPVAYALFFIALLFPLYRWLANHTNRGAAITASVTVLLACFCAFGLGLWSAGIQLADYLDQHSDRIESARSGVERWAHARELTLPWESEQGGEERLARSLWRAVEPTTAFVGGGVLTLAFFAFGLQQADSLGRRRMLLESRRDWRDIGRDIGRNVRRYFVARTVVGLATGALVAAACGAMGLEMPLVWGLANYLLNYIPTIGSIVGVIPPTLFSVVQHQSVDMVLLTAGVVGGVQLLMGNFVDPYVQSRYVDLSGFTVLFSVVFWGFMWGSAGAFIGVPLAMVAVLIGRRFRGAASLVELMTRSPQSREPVRPSTSTGDET